MKTGALIGRFQFLHNSHYELIKWGLTQVDHLIICLGSHAIAPTSRNPFTAVERANHIKTCFPNANISFAFIHDHPENDNDWVNEVVMNANQLSLENTNNIILLGHKKADTEWYIDLYKNRGWEYINYEHEDTITASKVRDLAYNEDSWKEYVPEQLHKTFSDWLASDAGHARSAEYLMEERYKEPYKNLPHPPIFHTVDSIVICQGHILLVKRGKTRGKGLFATPGGFLEHGESLLKGAIRELREETEIELSDDILKQYWTGESLTLDNPNRSLIGRIISEVFYFNLPNDCCGGKLPYVKGADDADEAIWMPVEKLKGDYYRTMDNVRIKFFEDHLYAIKQFLTSPYLS